MNSNGSPELERRSSEPGRQNPLFDSRITRGAWFTGIGCIPRDWRTAPLQAALARLNSDIRGMISDALEGASNENKAR